MISKDASSKDFISSIIMFAVLLLIIGFICWLYNSIYDTKSWNGGHCKCGATIEISEKR